MNTHARKKRPQAPMTEYVTPADGNVFADLGFPPDEAANLLVRADLMSAVERRVHGMSQVAAAKLLGVSQPRVSDIKRGKIGNFTIDALVNMLGSAGVRIDVSFRSVGATAVRERPPAYGVKRKRSKHAR